ncbi:MAG: DUF429 domain-containing protein [Rubripirellula sp.]|uniref:DUF429 domain-containing protein n=1 Tax=Stieleria tagensis TaxID=2956795 RepID=UPI00209AE063|nr:DUF429 domain-containing protein [Stieleria tagensis]MCO8122619.1 DUF429 domain-containing protein [Stieleria tagensis]
MRNVFVGFDSAWSANNSGAICAATVEDGGPIQLSVPPTTASFEAATQIIETQTATSTQTIIFLDQPHIVRNRSGSRPVERLASAPVGRRYGGIQRSATHEPKDRVPMFGPEAPVWNFVKRFGGPASPFKKPQGETVVFETYPVLYIIANNWLLDDKRGTGRLPKYNPARKKTFSVSDWMFICSKAADLADDLKLDEISLWLKEAMKLASPNKAWQDKLDAAICLLQAVEWHQTDSFLVIGDMATGYIVTKSSSLLENELVFRCAALAKEKKDGIEWLPENWIRRVTKRSNTPWKVESVN